MQEGNVIPWNNLVEIAKTDEIVKDNVVKFLQQNGVEDYRITHNQPYIRIGYSDSYRVTDTGSLSEEEIPNYELDFAVNRELVLQAYDYIRAYFENETSLIDKLCADAADIKDADFTKSETTTDSFNRNSAAQKRIYDFISLYNALPDDNDDNHHYDGKSAAALIPERYQNEHPIPGSRKIESGYRIQMAFSFSKKLLSFDNPIFQDHFGETFETELTAKKEAQQQQMFDTVLTVLKRVLDIWQSTKPKQTELQEREKSLHEELWADTTDEISKEAIRKKLEPINKRLSFYREKDSQTTSLILNCLYSIFDGNKNWFHLKRLKPEQGRILAEFAVRDEKDIILSILNTERYEDFCDYLKILETQTNRVIAGNYQLTDMMQVVASKYGYQPATNKEGLTAFVEDNHKGRYRNDKIYSWYMHVFDVMQHLEKSSSINLRYLAIAMANIQQSEKSSRGDAPHEIVHARYINYRKLLKHRNITALLARAIDCEENYEGLSCDELVETADSLITMRNEMAKVFSGKSDYDYSGSHKSQTTPEQEQFLSLVDDRIRSTLKKAEDQALQKDNALEKITDLYRLHNPNKNDYSSEGSRSAHLQKIEKSEKRRERLSKLSQDDSFWPEDALDHVKAFVFAKSTFLDDKIQEDKILNDILLKVEALPPGRKKSDCLYTLLDKNMRAAYPETRDRLFAIYTTDVVEKLGKDDKSEKYQKRLAVYLKALEGGIAKEWDIGKKHGSTDGLLSNSMSLTDKYLLLRRLTDGIISQEQTSYMAKEACAVKLNSDDMLTSYLYGIGVDYLTEEMDRDAEMANKFIQFLCSKGEQKDCAEISAFIEAKSRKKHSKLQDRLDEILKNTRPSNCKILYENFWAAPLEARAVITARMLKGATNENDENDTSADSTSWEQVFDLVINNLIQADDDSVEAKYARDIMHSYIKSRSDYERVLIMSAMMVANRNIGNDAGNIGKALKLFLENMGPAEIKLGQAIASHPDTPEKIKVELQELKNSADIPARWTLYDWIKIENIPEEFWKDNYVGEILGSASYYTTAALGEEEVLRILRPEAREKAGKGFKVIRSTVDDLNEKEETSGLSYGELTSSVQEMIVQAARMSDIETDHEIGQQQYEHARKIYNGVTIKSGEESFPLKVMDWRARGKNWIIMDRAKGPTFNALPENTPEEITYKRQFAIGYIVFELQNILSGRKFDHDKHGAQLSIDPNTNMAGIYDTGAMALRDPTPEEQKLLGNIVYGVLKGSLKGNETFSSLSSAIGDTINDLHAKDQDTQYLVEVKKGLLALGDFFRILTPEDIKSILPAIDLSRSTSKDVYQGITEKMSMFERAQLQTLLAIQAAQGTPNIAILRNTEKSHSAVNVLIVAVAPGTRDKASWLQETFRKPDDNTRQSESSSFTAIPENPSCLIP